MLIVSERIPHLRPAVSLEARELTVESFHLTEEELAKPLPGRVRRRGPGPRNEPPPGEAAPESGPSPVERRGKEPRGRGHSEPQPDQTGRKPRPPRPPRGSKRPLSDIAALPDDSPSVAETPPNPRPPEPPTTNDDFSAGIDIPPSPSGE